MDEPIVILWDKKVKKPACVLLSALFTNDPRASKVIQLFREWQVNYHPENLVKISGTWEEWKKVAEKRNIEMEIE